MIIDTLRSVLRFRRFEFSATKRRLRKAASIDDLRAIARRRLPGGVFDYIDGGAEDEVAMDRNTRAFRELEFVPRVLRDMGHVDTSGTILGREVPFPLILAPTGFTRIAHPPGELAAARSAERAGLPYALSTMGTRSVEEVAAVSDGIKWFQVYVWRDKGLLKDMILRGQGGRLRGAVHHRGRGHARPPRARCASGLHASAQDGRGDPLRGHVPARVEPALRLLRADLLRQRPRATPPSTGPPRWISPAS